MTLLTRPTILFLLFGLLFFPSIPAFAGSAFDGTFVYISSGTVSYFSLTETNSQVAGFFYSVRADSSDINGLKETRVNLSGMTDGRQVNFRQGQGDFSTTLGWVGRASNAGFSLSYPSPGGYISEQRYRRVSADELNASLSYLRQSIAQQKAAQAYAQLRHQLQSQLNNSQLEIQKTLADRPGLLRAMNSATASLKIAQDKVDGANAEVALREANIVKAQKVVDAADAVAQTSDERSKANDLRSLVSDRYSEASDARSKLRDAEYDLRNTKYDADVSRRRLLEADSRIAELRSLIGRTRTSLQPR